MILAGGLDHNRESDLADRLGLSERHLRRLFTSQLGLTPSTLARSARVRFAQGLLVDTGLTMTDVAYAAGFGSLRHFNRVCHEAFGVAPRELRRRGSTAGQTVPDAGLELRLPYEGALDWPATTARLAARTIASVESVVELVYRRVVLVGGAPGVVELSAGGPGHLVLRAHLPRWEELVHVVARARQVARLDLDPALGPRAPGAWDAFESGVRAILDEPPRPGVEVLLDRLVRRLGRPIDGWATWGLSAAFPSPQTIAGNDLTGLGIPADAADAMRTLARAVATGRDVSRMGRVGP